MLAKVVVILQKENLDKIVPDFIEKKFNQINIILYKAESFDELDSNSIGNRKFQLY